MIVITLGPWCVTLRRRNAVCSVRPRLRDALLSRARSALRLRKLELAHAVVMEYGETATSDAACLNVLGLIAEARGQWKEARRCWGRALCFDRTYAPPRQNLARYYELCQWGRSDYCAAFGDETARDLLRAQCFGPGNGRTLQ